MPAHLNRIKQKQKQLLFSYANTNITTSQMGNQGKLSNENYILEEDSVDQTVKRSKAMSPVLIGSSMGT